MQQLTLTDRGVTWTQASAPRIDDARAAVVRPIAASTCDFDHLLCRGAMPFPLPVALGHEAVAVVEQVGGDVTGVAPGDVVVVPFQISCGTCESCRSGRTSSCHSVDWLSCYGLGALSGGHGGLVADLALVPYADAMLVPLPPEIAPASAAAVSCNVVDAYRCVVPQLAQHPGADVLVVGGAFASIALYAARLAQVSGAGVVHFYAHDEVQRERAAAIGIDVLDELAPDARHYPVTVDASMDAELLGRAVRATSRGGTLTMSTMYVDPAARLPLMAMFERGLTITTGQPHARALVPAVLELMSRGGVALDDVTTAVADWADAPDAFLSGAGKTVLVRGD